MTEMIEFILPIFTLSNIFFFTFIKEKFEVNPYTLVSLIIGILHAALPMEQFN